MRVCDALIVGGGPAGSSCARALREGGLDVVVIDKARFPRDKPCAGWITPRVVERLGIDAGAYAREGVMQPITAFRVAMLGRRAVEVDYGRAVSYGILRREFDAYLLERCGAETVEGEAVASIRLDNGAWEVNGRFRASMLIGAGGHFCPVARFCGARPNGEHAVVASEVEFALSASQRGSCAVEPGVPELYFLPDLSGYGWCFRKGEWLNIGLGTLDRRALHSWMRAFLEHVRESGRARFDPPEHFHGHAYLLAGGTSRVALPGVALIGDAAGLAHACSGEGILPAVESGLATARGILEGCAGCRSRAARVERREPAIAGSLRGLAARGLLSNAALARRFVIDRLFLHAA